ncbi:MAG: ribbon-helix-helix protein, CopG family [Deltaproteobacteria bacterium]|nr:ribbon-helix-helix protein, CopG family [Deltaproteobacteria bacterium]
MATTVHIPKDLLDAVDDRARALKLSRNRFVIRALSQALSEDDSWSPEFLEALEGTDESDAATVDEMLEAIKSNRSIKKPLEL